MIDKRSGKVAYAVMSFGGFLGIGDDHRALPWSVLRYNENLDAYELNVTDDQLRGAPALASGWNTGSVDRAGSVIYTITIASNPTGERSRSTIRRSGYSRSEVPLRASARHRPLYSGR